MTDYMIWAGFFAAGVLTGMGVWLIYLSWAFRNIKL